MPAKLAGRVRSFDTGHDRKPDARDAHSIAMIAVRNPGLRVLAPDGELEARCGCSPSGVTNSPGNACRPSTGHRLLSKLVPGQRKRDLSAAQAEVLLAGVRPRDVAGKTRWRMAAEELADLVVLDKKLKRLKAELKAELKTAVIERGSTLLDVYGIGPAGAARILADVGDVARFAGRNRFASWTGTAPLDASLGEHIPHRLSRAGNRRMNHVIHIAAIVQLRLDTEGRAYDRRELAGSGSGSVAPWASCAATARIRCSPSAWSMSLGTTARRRRRPFAMERTIRCVSSLGNEPTFTGPRLAWMRRSP